MYGILIEFENRSDILFENGTLYGGLHCGECFSVLLDQWYPVRLEYQEDWILIYKNQVLPIPYSHQVFME